MLKVSLLSIFKFNSVKINMKQCKNLNYLQDFFSVESNKRYSKKKISLAPIATQRNSIVKENVYGELRSIYCGTSKYSSCEDLNNPFGSPNTNTKISLPLVKAKGLPSLKPLVHHNRSKYSMRSSNAFKIINKKLFVQSSNRDLDVTFSNDFHTPVPSFGEYNFVGK